MQNTNTNKTKSKISPISFTAILFPLGLIILTIVRFLQYSLTIRIDNGFFELDGGFLNISYYLTLVLLLGVFTLSFVVDKKHNLIPSLNSPVMPDSKKAPSSAFGFVGAFIFALSSFLMILELIEIYDKYSITARTVAVAIAALGLSFATYLTLSSKAIKPILSLSVLSLSIYSLSEAVNEFMLRTYVTNLSARFLILLSYIIFAIFFINCGRTLVKIETKHTRFFMLIFGYLGSLIALSDGVAKLVYFYSLDSETRGFMKTSVWSNGFELPAPLFITIALSVLWLTHALKTAPIGLKVDENINETQVGKTERIEDNKNANDTKNTDDTEKNKEETQTTDTAANPDTVDIDPVN